MIIDKSIRSFNMLFLDRSEIDMIFRLYIVWRIWFPQPLPKWRQIKFDKLRPGDKIRVNVGFENRKQIGVVSTIMKDQGYMWCDIDGKTGRYLRSFTASASYGQFEVLK